MTNSNDRRPMDSESVVSLALIGVCSAFWGAYMLLILFGEVPELVQMAVG